MVTTLGSRQMFQVRSPADGRVLTELAIDSPDRVVEMAAKLRGAQPEWESLGPARRSKHLLEWLNWIMDNEQQLLDLVQAETGKSWGDTAFETAAAVEVINYVTRNAARWLSDETVRPSGPANVTKQLRVHWRPHQLVGVITPWNLPFAMPMLDVPFALAAGAAVLTKPSEVTPLAWREAVRGWREIGAPLVLDCASGLATTGEAVVDQVDMVQFTGSTRTGRAIAVRAAHRLIPCSLELGGKDAMIVLDDANIDRAVRGAVWGSMFNSGQACISVERLYVHEKIYDDFVSKLACQIEQIRQGTEFDHSFRYDIGALATPAQVDIVDGHVRDAVAKGARVLTGGRRGEVGNYYAPTLIVDVDHSMDCMRAETFGPTLPVMRFSSDDEAVRLANDSDYGLSGSVWTNDAARARRIAKQLDTGGVCVNNVMTGVFQFPIPFGGWRQSGLGTRLGGANSVRKYCHPQSFVAERLVAGKELNWYPYRPRRSRLMRAAIRALGMHDWRRRLGRAPARRR